FVASRPTSAWRIGAGAWSTVDVDNIPYAVWGTSASDVWMGGWLGTMHFNGSTWLLHNDEMIKAFSGTSASDVLAIGKYGRIEHWNGTQWSTVAEVRGTFRALAGHLAAGRRGELQYYDGTMWSVLRRPAT